MRPLLVTGFFLIFATLLVVVALKVFNGPFNDWNARRLVPSFALARGYPVYYPSNDLLMIAGVNGPITHMAYLPATLAKSPTPAVHAGVALALFYFVSASLFLLLVAFRSYRNTGLFLRLATVAMFFLMAFRSRALGASSSLIHADAPGITLSALAFGALLLQKRRNWIGDLVVGTAAALAFCSKITFLPLIAAIPTYVFVTEGKRSGARMLLFVLGCVVFWVVIFGLWFGFEELYFFNWPAKSPMVKTLDVAVDGSALTIESKASVLLSAILEILKEYWLLVGALVIAGVVTFRRSTAGVGAPWLLAAWISICMIPPSLLGRVKGGGDINTQSPTVYFFVVAFCLCFLEWANRKKIIAAMGGGLIGLLLLLQIKNLPKLIPLSFSLQNPGEMAFEFAKRHPEEVYFPEFPLSNFMASGRPTHSGATLSEFISLGYKYSDENLKKNLPENLHWIAYHDSEPFEPLRKLLPGFSQRVSLPELPGWIVLAEK